VGEAVGDSRLPRAPSIRGRSSPSGKQRRLETAGPAREEVSSERLAHNGTVRVTSFLTSCQAASSTVAGPLLCRRRQLDVARR